MVSGVFIRNVFLGIQSGLFVMTEISEIVIHIISWISWYDHVAQGYMSDETPWFKVLPCLVISLGIQYTFAFHLILCPWWHRWHLHLCSVTPTSVELSNYINVQQRIVITHPCPPNFNDGLVKQPLKFWNGWATTSYIKNGLYYVSLWPLLLTWFNFNPSMDK